MGGSRYLYGSRVDPGKRTSRNDMCLIVFIIRFLFINI